MKTCYFKGCRNKARALGLCGGHYRQRRQRQELRPLRGAHGYVGAVRLSFSLTQKEVALLKNRLPRNIKVGAFLAEFVRDQLKGRR